jgi:hypothetical protein
MQHSGLPRQGPDPADPHAHAALSRPADVSPAGGHLWRSWFGWVTCGETAGFCVPAVVAAVTSGGHASGAVPALLVAGAAEGAVLGLAQAHVLRRALPGLPVLRWVAATSAAAAFAWLLGLLPSTLSEQLSNWPGWLQAAAGMVGGTALLLSIGTAQWLVLRGRVARASRWIGVTAAAWLAGLAAFLAVASPLWHEGQSMPMILLIGAVAGLVMAATVAAITGFGLIRLLRSR